MNAERYARQADIVPHETMHNLSVGIAGCGAIGRQLALQLAAMGIRSLLLADFDRVETVNLGPQGWREDDLHQYKVDALRRQLDEINSEMEIGVIRGRFPTTPPDRSIDTLFLAVDSIDARRELVDVYGPREEMSLIVDGRMAGETIRVLTINLEDDSTSGLAAYRNTLFTADQAHRGQCTSRSTIYAASIAAGLMINQFTAFLRQRPTVQDTTLALASLDLVTTGWLGAVNA